MLSMVFRSNYWIPAERVNIKCALVFGQCWLIFIWKHFLLLLLFSSSGLIGFVKRISKWNLQLVLYIILLWMQNYSCPDKKRWIGQWSMRTMATFHSSQRWSTRGSTTSQSHGMMTPTLIAGRLTSLTCLGMKPECLKSAPSPLSSLDTEVKSKLAIGSFLFYFSFLGIWLILGFWFLNCFLQRSTCKRSGQLWNPLWKSMTFHVNLIW